MILVIDDDSAVRTSLSFMLKRAGYEVKAVNGPREAMEVVRSERPDLALMDMNFTLSTTGEEGLTLLRQVKVFRPDMPVILMTAWGSIELAVQGMQAGGEGMAQAMQMQQKMYQAMAGDDMQQLQQRLAEAMMRGDMAEYGKLLAEIQQKMMGL